MKFNEKLFINRDNDIVKPSLLGMAITSYIEDQAHSSPAYQNLQQVIIKGIVKSQFGSDDYITISGLSSRSQLHMLFKHDKGGLLIKTYCPTIPNKRLSQTFTESNISMLLENVDEVSEAAGRYCDYYYSRKEMIEGELIIMGSITLGELKSWNKDLYLCYLDVCIGADFRILNQIDKMFLPDEIDKILIGDTKDILGMIEDLRI